MNNKNLEIACFNGESAVIAQENGADRVELCANMLEGGTSPDFETALKVRAELSIKMNVMIRPRGGDFVYTDAEFEQMKSEIKRFKKINVDGFVFGILNTDSSFDMDRNKELVALASPVPCTFHRAFDVVANVYKSLELLIDCGFKTVLTSGQAENVVEGMDVLQALVEKADDRIVVMPGGGLRSTNIEFLDQKVHASFYHSSAITDSTEMANGDEVRKIKLYLR
ncbi:copper homeostasis protein CutC [Flavobacterium maritimum]|uniref:copper homeostasis protein CutC n=1 Tax=Flavobacterium maritimum TaxID=3149042 RepID=UPI0032B3B456